MVMNRRLWFLAATIMLALTPLAGCGDSSDATARPVIADDATPPPAGPGSPLDGLPATFAGVLPCADCPGIEYTLNLLPNGSFALRRAYQDRPVVAGQDEVGRWVVASDQRTLTLEGGRDTLFFDMVSRSTVRMLDRNARPMAPSVKAELTRARAYEPLDVNARLRGGFVYLADAGQFTECATQQRWPVAREAENAELERVYAEQRAKPGAPLVVTVLGRVVDRPKVDGAGTARTLVVDRVVEASPGETCAAPVSSAELETTRWRLTHVRTLEVTPAPGEAVPTLILQADTAQFSSSGGCNRQLGTFRRDGSALTFAPAVTTRMDCPAGMEAEEAFVKVLPEVASWRILGRLLELSDSSGALVARFEAGEK
jgi:copper homeostasis protein (lipoprotein)